MSEAAAVVTHGVEKRPPSAAPEPPFKKIRVELVQAPLGDLAPNHVVNTPPVPNQSYSLGSNSTHHSHGSFPPGSAKGPGTAALFYKTKLCTKFTLGSCTFNERCHFAHGMEDLRTPPPGWEELVKQGATSNVGSTELPPVRKSNKPCRYYVNGNCPYGERCTFSHGNEDAQRAMVPTVDSLSGLGTGNAPGRSNYKTRLCTRWEKGEPCMYGDKCHFAHGQAELQAYSGGINYNNASGTTPNLYSDQNSLNPPPMVASYGAPLNYGNAGVHPAPLSACSNLYGGNASSYGSQQDGTSGYSANYSYCNQENKWDGAHSAVPSHVVTLPPSGYGLANHNAPWMASYSVEGSYTQKEGFAAPLYMQERSQEQPVAPYPRSAPTYCGPNPSFTATYQGSNQSVVSSYQGPSQNVNPSYMQDGPQNGDGGAYHGAGYPNQHTGYIGGYNVM